VKTRIYIVDDHALIRRGLATLIGGESDMEVCGQAEDAPTALRDVMKIQPELVILDLSLKGNSGLELIKSIQAFNPKIQILVLSMHPESIYALRVLKAGARAYVMKQEVVNKVLEAIRRIRSGNLFVSDNVANQMLSRLAAGKAADDTSPVSVLSDRELEIVNLIGSGLLTREIAVQLHLSSTLLAFFQFSTRAHEAPLSVVEVALASGVALLDLAEDFGFVAWAAGQIDREQFDDVACAQKWRMATGVGPLLQQEQQRETGQRDMVVPAGPATHFILGQAQLALGVLKAAFDPETLRLHIGQTFPRGIRGRIAQRVFEGAVGVLPDNQ